MTVLGAARQPRRKQARGGKRWYVTVHLDDGSTRTLSNDVEPFWHAGDRVRLLNGQLQPV